MIAQTLEAEVEQAVCEPAGECKMYADHYAGGEAMLVDRYTIDLLRSRKLLVDGPYREWNKGQIYARINMNGKNIVIFSDNSLVLSSDEGAKREILDWAVSAKPNNQSQGRKY